MKRIFLIIAIVAAAFGVKSHAQENWSHSGIFAEAGLGVACGDIDTDLGFSVGVGYRYHFGNGFNWDVVKVSYYNCFTTTACKEGSSMRFLTGFRYNSEPILAGKPLYGTFSAGYQLNVYDTDAWKGFAYEIGAGVMVTPNVSLGLMWEGNVAHYNLGWLGSVNENFGTFGIKAAFQF
ncbi:MAG: outer membrane beta-barrel protein [Muribaculaceae bacterium]